MKYFFLIALCAFIIEGSSSQPMGDQEPIKLEGRTMGATYVVIYFDGDKRDLKFSIDSVLQEVNKGINNYDTHSEVSKFNASTTGVESQSIHFRNGLQRSLKFAEVSNGNFDPTVMPLVNLWGFGPEKKGIPSQVRIDSIRNFIGHHRITINQNHISKNHPNVQVDFGGIGQGYGVDVVADFMRSKGIRNFLIELGGEGFASGTNLKNNSKWRIGIIDPLSSKDEQQLMGYALIEDEAFTTSGNYFNYRMIDGKKYGHTISPFTGFPTEHELISVSLFTTDCTTADAWDTAFLASGKQKTIEFLNKHKTLAAVLVYMENGKPAVFVTENIKSRIFLESLHDH
jgi:thiamine biosynthesis lipoprotein